MKQPLKRAFQLLPSDDNLLRNLVLSTQKLDAAKELLSKATAHKINTLREREELIRKILAERFNYIPSIHDDIVCKDGDFKILVYDKEEQFNDEPLQSG